MRRENFTVAFTNLEDEAEEIPTVRIEYGGDDDRFDERLAEVFDRGPEPEQIDVTYRHRGSEAEGPLEGVLSLTTRVTGEYVVEANHPASDVHDLVASARERTESGDVQYRVELHPGGSESLVFEKRTLLVYDADGSLLRQKSLIPNGVEL